MRSYIIEIANVMPPMMVEFPAASDEDAVQLAARIVKGHVDDLPLDNVACVRLAGEMTVIVLATVERFARSVGQRSALKHLLTEGPAKLQQK